MVGTTWNPRQAPDKIALSAQSLMRSVSSRAAWMSPASVL